MTKKTSNSKNLTVEQELKKIVMEELVKECSRWIIEESNKVTKLNATSENEAMKNLYDQQYMLKRGSMGDVIALAIVKGNKLLSSKAISMTDFSTKIISQYSDQIIKDTIDDIASR